MEQALTVVAHEIIPQQPYEAMSLEIVKGQVNLIQQILKEVMKEDEHYGLIPGCGNKPALLKPGAEKLSLTFRMAPKYKIERVDMPGGHREYIVDCFLYGINSEQFLGSGVGSCSTMEAKYRYRTGPKEFTGKPVPKEYWDLRKSDFAKAQKIIGGKGFSTARNEQGRWEICVQGEKVEHDNPADYYNTVLKMAKKRAHVDAVLTVTAASDIFTQDIEEMVVQEEDVAINPDVTTKNGNGNQANIDKAIAYMQSKGYPLEQLEQWVGLPKALWEDKDLAILKRNMKEGVKPEVNHQPPAETPATGNQEPQNGELAQRKYEEILKTMKTSPSDAQLLAEEYCKILTPEQNQEINRLLDEALKGA